MQSPFKAAELQALLDEMARDAPFPSIDALNARLAQRMQQYNTTPQPELGGLSPDQAAQLLYGDWATVGAFRVTGEAAPEALAGARGAPEIQDKLFHACRRTRERIAERLEQFNPEEAVDG